MCEYCGCQAVASINLLTREHDAAVALVSPTRAAAAAGDPRAAVLARELRALLGPHTVVEEDGLFAEMAGDFPDHVAALRAEHDVVDAVLAEAADGLPSDPSWSPRLVAVLELLREHILKEQDGLFPAALSALGTPGWERVEAVRDRVGSHLTDPVTADSATADPAGG